MRPRRRSSSGVGTAFVLVGAATVLGAAFTAGVYTGTWWSSASRRGEPTGAAIVHERDVRESADAHPERPRSELPALTFYQELTAPLTAPPPPPKPRGARGDGPKIVVRDASPRAAFAPHDTVGAAADDVASRAYTVQVGAYKSREPAEALRAKLVAAGHAAEIVTAEGAGARFRVRVGAYPTRDAAREAAARIAAERALPTLVIAR